MLITVYQKKGRKFVPVGEYYWWRVKTLEELKEEGIEDTPTKMICPGCGKTATRYAIRYQHKCPGSQTDKPVKGRAPNRQVSRKNCAEYNKPL